jgi:hypothetical protein
MKLQNIGIGNNDRAGVIPLAGMIFSMGAATKKNYLCMLHDGCKASWLSFYIKRIL